MYENVAIVSAMGNSEGYRYEAKLDRYGQPPTLTEAEKAIERVPGMKDEPRMGAAQTTRRVYVVFEYGVVKEVVVR